MDVDLAEGHSEVVDTGEADAAEGRGRGEGEGGGHQEEVQSWGEVLSHRTKAVMDSAREWVRGGTVGGGTRCAEPAQNDKYTSIPDSRHVPLHSIAPASLFFCIPHIRQLIPSRPTTSSQPTAPRPSPLPQVCIYFTPSPLLRTPPLTCVRGVEHRRCRLEHPLPVLQQRAGVPGEEEAAVGGVPAPPPAAEEPGLLHQSQAQNQADVQAVGPCSPIQSAQAIQSPPFPHRIAHQGLPT